MQIENVINERLIGDARKNALEFIAYLRENEIQLEREVGGYWDDKFYYGAIFNNNFVCFILISNEEKTDPESWTVWSDDSGSRWFEDYLLDERLKEVAWKNVDVCGNETDTACGGCPSIGGQPKTVFGKLFNNTCGTTFRFNNPSGIEIDCLMELMNIRKKDILKLT